MAATRAEHRLLLFGTHRATKDSTIAPETEGLEFLESLSKAEDKANSFLTLLSQGLQSSPERVIPMKTKRIPPLKLTDRIPMLQNLEQKYLKFLETGIHGSKELSEERGAGPGFSITGKKLEAFYAQDSKSIVCQGEKTSSPSEMEQWFQSSRTAGASTPLPALAIDPLLSKTDLESAFGTLCHYAIETTIREAEVSIPPSVSWIFQSAGIPVTDRETLLQEAVGLAEKFFSSPMGQSLLRAPRRRSEFPFLLPLSVPDGSTIIVQGIMDAIFETGAHAVILDFKTDRTREPESHQIQLECYRHANRFGEFGCNHNETLALGHQIPLGEPLSFSRIYARLISASLVKYLN